MTQPWHAFANVPALCPMCGERTLVFGAIIPVRRNHVECLACKWQAWDAEAVKIGGYDAAT